MLEARKRYFLLTLNFVQEIQISADHEKLFYTVYKVEKIQPIVAYF